VSPELSAAVKSIMGDLKEAGVADSAGIADRAQVNSTVRTTDENKKVGGSGKSDHVTDDASKKSALDLHFYKDGKIVNKQVYTHLAEHPNLLNKNGYGFQVILHGHEAGKGLPLHVHIGWKGSRGDNQFTTERASPGEPGGYHVRTVYSPRSVTSYQYPWQ
jgi:hypothetical protein